MLALASDLLGLFQLLLWNRSMEFTETWQETRTQLFQPHLWGFFDRSKRLDDCSASDWLRHFWIRLWNRSAEYGETWQEARTQFLLQNLRVFGRSENHDDNPCLWLAYVLFLSLLKCWMEFDELGSKQDLNVLCKVMFFWPIDTPIWSSWRLISWHMFKSFSATQNGIWPNLTGIRTQNPWPSLWFSGRMENQDDLLDLWLAVTFPTFIYNRWTECFFIFDHTSQVAGTQCPLPSLWFKLTEKEI